MSAQSSFRIDRPSVVSEIIDGEAVILDLRRGSYVSLRGSGAAIWAGLEAGAPITAIAAQLAAAHADSAESAQSVVETFLGELVSQNLIVAGQEPHPAALPAYSGTGPLMPPVVEMYSDMEDILLLDPIHDVEVSGWPARKALNSAG